MAVAPLEPATEERLVLRPSSGKIPRPVGAQNGRILWGYVLGVVGFHLLLPLAFIPWLFTWTGVASVFLGNYFFCSMGIGAGYHRFLTHRGFSCPRWFERTLTVLGVCCLQDAPARWVAIHRLHHNHSDNQPDPHTPHVSWFWSHVGWLFVENRELSRISTYEKYARDVLQDPFYFWLERRLHWIWVYVAHVVAIYVLAFGIGWAWGGSLLAGLQFGLSMLVWGVVVRTVYTWHVTWGVNSASHIWGYRNYETGENSRNNWLFALATNGEGWHNNHHADPRSAAHGHRWWELDVT